ncbi:DHCW motif cupin fold protein [Kineococcus gypseus]|uniref:DHCW motif cupin fold protein n=1 Tax=Kineococcus gypseus TaxID=1637102 RepID=UPI003D7CE169
MLHLLHDHQLDLRERLREAERARLGRELSAARRRDRPVRWNPLARRRAIPGGPAAELPREQRVPAPAAPVEDAWSSVRSSIEPLTVLPWERVPRTVRPGATGTATWRERRAGPVRLRMVEYSPGYSADHWCERGHVLLVLHGRLTTELSDGTLVNTRAGESYHAGDGPASAHRSSTTSGARLFVVD